MELLSTSGVCIIGVLTSAGSDSHDGVKSSLSGHAVDEFRYQPRTIGSSLDMEDGGEEGEGKRKSKGREGKEGGREEEGRFIRV